MNILYICHEYPPCKQGGVGTFTKDIATYMAKRGHNVHTVGVYFKSVLNLEHITSTIEDGVSVVRIPYPNKYRNSILNVFYSRYIFARYINKYIKTNNIDIVESPDNAGWFPLGVKCKIFITRLHGCTGYFERILGIKKSKLFKCFEKMQFGRVSNIIAVSNYVGKITADIYGLKKSIDTIYNGVYIPSRQRLEECNGSYIDRYILFFGTINDRKGVAELLEAFSQIKDNYPNLKLLLAGKIANNEYNNSVLKIADSSNGRIKFLGALDRYSELPNYIQNSLFCCFPSKAEAFSIAPLEAMMYEKPILISTACAAPELVDEGVDGVFCDPYSIKSIKDGLITLLNDEVKRREMGVAARLKTINKFDNLMILRQNEDYYNNLLNQKDSM